MLIFCCGMPRSGGTLLYQLVKEIVESNNLGRGRGFPNEKYRSGVVKTDTCHAWMIERVKSGSAIAFGTYRDFRDVIVSLQKFYTRRAIERFGKPTRWSINDVLLTRSDIIDIQQCWQPYATWFRYEEPAFCYTIVTEVSRQLKIKISSAQVSAIIDKYSLKSNQERIQRQKTWMEAGNGSMLTKIHISETKGKSTWREVLSEEDLTKIMAIGGDWLRAHGYE